MKVSEVKKILVDLPDDLDLDLDTHNTLDVFNIKTSSKEYSVTMELSISRYGGTKTSFMIRYSVQSPTETAVKTIYLKSYKILIKQYNRYKQKILDGLSPQEKMELL